ncbi:MAG: AI-2E family transporter [Candidatus Shapirobacteria bacterium]|nr:AI-2E family transporter [Candidatus Shapirobacteria bacterium]
MKAQKVEITYRTIIFTVLFLISLLVLWQLRPLILTVFLCFLFMEGLHPAVNWLEKIKMPRVLAILLVYLFIIAALSFSVVGVIPDLVDQSTVLIKNLPAALKNIDILGLNFVDFSSQLKILENLPGSITSLVMAIFSNLLSIFVFFVITFYLLLERKNFDKYLKSIFGQKSLKAITIFNQLEKRLGIWVGAQLTLMLIIGILSYLGYVIIGVNFALPLAIIAGILELVPNIGPTIASILAGIFGLTISPITGVLAVIWGIIVQQLENNFIVPKIMKEAIGINPLITILLIASGAKLGGVVGAVIALPLYITIETIYRALNTDKN